MFENRVMPCLQLLDESLVKTVQFGKYSYIGDPLNTCRIFNELEVDEMIILGIRVTQNNERPDFSFLRKMSSECFMPLSYGGGIKTLRDAKEIFSSGFEKIVINSILFEDIGLIKQIVDIYGSQSVIASIDIKKNIFGKYIIYSRSGMKKESVELEEWVEMVQEAGAGEIMLTDISAEGTWKGFDIPLIQKVAHISDIPLIVHGGAGCRKDVEDAVNVGGASAVALGSMVVFQQKGMGVLINYDHDYQFG